MRRVAKFLLGLSLVCFAGLSWGTDLYGSPVTGGLYFSGGGTNYFDPANGFVPAGYGNSGPGNNVNVVISDWGEFGFSDGANFLVANFTHTQLIITDFSTVGNINATTFTFESPSFVGISLDSSSFPSNISASINGDIITVELSTFSGHTGLFQANWTISTEQGVPEPGTMVMLGSGLLAAATTAKKRWLQ
jgi:hypothetical protein